MKTLSFYVSKDNINKGHVGVPNECPMALALNQLTGKYVHMGSAFVIIADDVYRLSRSASNFVKRFDTLKPVRPQKFVLTLVEFLLNNKKG